MIAFYWLLAAAVFLGLEILTMGLTTIWFAGGALIAAFMALVQFSIMMQVIAFVLVSLLLLFITKPLATRFLNNSTESTNVESLIGQKCIVTKSIDNLRSVGEVNIRGQIWSARSVQEEIQIPANAIVKVEEISGVKLIVSVVSYPEHIALPEKG